MKRIFKLLMCFAFLNIFLFTSIFAAANITVEGIKAKPGQEVNINVSIQNNPGFIGYQIALYYDSSKLEYLSSKNGEMLEGSMAVISNIEDKGVVKQVCVGESNNLNGTLMTVIFKLKDNILVNSIPLDLKVEEIENDSGNLNIYDVDYEVSNSSIEVIKESSDITVTSNNAKFNIIKTEDGKFRVEPNTDKISNNIKYKSSDETKATVDENGNIDTLSDGDVEIEAYIDDEKVESIKLHIPSEEEIKEKENLQIIDTSILKNNSINIIVIIVVILIVILVIAIIFFVKKKKGNKKYEKK